MHYIFDAQINYYYKSSNFLLPNPILPNYITTDTNTNEVASVIASSRQYLRK